LRVLRKYKFCFSEYQRILKLRKIYLQQKVNFFSAQKLLKLHQIRDLSLEQREISQRERSIVRARKKTFFFASLQKIQYQVVAQLPPPLWGHFHGFTPNLRGGV